ncbi:MAG: hypothetical protein H0V76_08945 [Blastocatellia bacterium]|nr:hypothetical protein [Blastocatellia bacterium]
MHCPKCGQQQATDDTRFCSRCGFLLTGIAQVVDNGGIVPGANTRTGQSPMRRGVYKGLFIFLSAALIVPLIAMITVALNAGPFAGFFALLLLTVGGILRMAYALMFESNIPGGVSLEEQTTDTMKRAFGKAPAHKELQESTIPADSYTPPMAGKWLDTNELQKTPGSVTEKTTRLLERDPDQ